MEKGTVGWLAKGLYDGTLTLVESTLKSNGHHGLWLHGPDGLSQFLGAFNVYGLEANYLIHAAKYEPPCSHEDREALWSSAAWDSLMALSQQWCDDCNNILANEGSIEINIVRSEIKEIANG